MLSYKGWRLPGARGRVGWQWCDAGGGMVLTEQVISGNSLFWVESGEIGFPCLAGSADARSTWNCSFQGSYL